MGFECKVCGCKTFKKISPFSEMSLIDEVVLISCEGEGCGIVYAVEDQKIATGALMKTR
ncbi:MAG: hypothetical protein NTU58_04115 [Candidatus Nealsonbacteria bacterium]|nr:hypothetical protein [Candidatus Nealsonbacteria bacterium]